MKNIRYSVSITPRFYRWLLFLYNRLISISNTKLNNMRGCQIKQIATFFSFFFNLSYVECTSNCFITCPSVGVDRLAKTKNLTHTYEKHFVRCWPDPTVKTRLIRHLIHVRERGKSWGQSIGHYRTRHHYLERREKGIGETTPGSTLLDLASFLWIRVTRFWGHRAVDSFFFFWVKNVIIY